MTKITIRKSPIQGKGVFAEKPIKKGSVVFKFSDQKTYFHREECNCKRCQYSIRISKNKALTPDKSSFGWYLNHSCDANSSIKGRSIIALRNIKQGEEITIDYSVNIPDKNWTMKCSCKAKNCRKVLKSIQYLPHSVFKKYKGKIPKFLEKIYSDSQRILRE